MGCCETALWSGLAGERGIERNVMQVDLVREHERICRLGCKAGHRRHLLQQGTKMGEALSLDRMDRDG